MSEYEVNTAFSFSTTPQEHPNREISPKSEFQEIEIDQHQHQHIHIDDHHDHDHDHNHSHTDHSHSHTHTEHHHDHSHNTHTQQAEGIEPPIQLTPFKLLNLIPIISIIIFSISSYLPPQFISDNAVLSILRNIITAMVLSNVSVLVWDLCNFKIPISTSFDIPQEYKLVTVLTMLQCCNYAMGTTRFLTVGVSLYNGSVVFTLVCLIVDLLLLLMGVDSATSISSSLNSGVLIIFGYSALYYLMKNISFSKISAMIDEKYTTSSKFNLVNRGLVVFGVGFFWFIKDEILFVKLFIHLVSLAIIPMSMNFYNINFQFNVFVIYIISSILQFGIGDIEWNWFELLVFVMAATTQPIKISIERTIEQAIGIDSIINDESEEKNIIHILLSHKDTNSIFKFLILNTLFMFIQFIYSFRSKSLGLLSDSLHMALDCTSLALGLVAGVLSKRSPNEKFPFGLNKIETLAGFTNGSLLLGIAGGIIIQGFERLFNPVSLQKTNELLIVSFLGLLVNLVGIFAFNHGHDHSHAHSHSHSHSHSNSTPDSPDDCEDTMSDNMKGIFLHILADTLGSVGVVISTLLTNIFHIEIFDPIASILIAILIFYSALPLIKSSSSSLLLSINIKKESVIRDTLFEISCIKGVTGYTTPRFWPDEDKVLGYIHIQIMRGESFKSIKFNVEKIFKKKGMKINVQLENDFDSCWCREDSEIVAN